MAYESYYTNKIIKTTKAQYDALKNGESVKGYKLNEKDTFVLDIDSLYNDIPTKTSQLTIDNAIPLVAGKNVNVTPNSNNELVISAEDSVKTVNNTAPDNNGNVALDCVSKTIMLPDNTDLNTVITSGFYRIQSNPINAPEYAEHGQMIVSKGADTIAQIVFPYAGSIMYIRTGNNINTTQSWKNWNKVSVQGHTHDDRYYTETEVDNKLDGKSNTGHTHQALKILCSINGANTNTYKYRRIMSTPVMTGNYTDMSGTYYLYGRYHDSPWYIFRVEVRTNNSSTGVLASAGIQVIATNRDPADLLGGLYTVATNGKTTTYLDVYYKSPYTYVRTHLAYLGVEPFGGWTYYNSNEDSNSTNPVNAYKTLEGNNSDAASFVARGIEKYTRIVYGSLVGKVGKSTYLVSPATSRITSANIDQTPLNGNSDGQGQLRLDLATNSMSINQPASPGYIMSYIWDNNVSVASQLFIPTGDYFVQGYRPSLRGCDKGTWQTSWTELAYYKDLNDYVLKVNKLADNVDLDTVTTTGFYRLMGINTIINEIDVSYSQMIVSQAGGDTIAQLIFPYAESKILFRTGNPIDPNNSNRRWNDWKTVSTDGHTHDDRYYTETEIDTKISGTSGTIPKFTAANTIGNSAITQSAQNDITIAGKLVVQSNGSTSNNSYNEGIRILPASNAWSNIFFSNNQTTSNQHANGWLLGKRGSNGTTSGLVGDFTIECNGSSGAGLTLSSDVKNKPRWNNNELAYYSDIPTYWANVQLSKTSNSDTTPTFASVDIKSKCTISYSATADALEFIFK